MFLPKITESAVRVSSEARSGRDLVPRFNSFHGLLRAPVDFFTGTVAAIRNILLKAIKFLKIFERLMPISKNNDHLKSASREKKMAAPWVSRPTNTMAAITDIADIVGSKVVVHFRVNSTHCQR